MVKTKFTKSKHALDKHITKGNDNQQITKAMSKLETIFDYIIDYVDGVTNLILQMKDYNRINIMDEWMDHI